MDRDEFFAGIYNEATPAAHEIIRMRQLAYEERIIKRVITSCGANVSHWGILARACRAATQEKQLNFEWFNAQFGSSFPCLLAGKRVPGFHAITLQELFATDVKKSKLVRKLMPAITGSGIDPLSDRYLFTFPIVKTQFCAHTLALEPAPDSHGIQIALNFSDAKRPITIEPLKNVCQAIGAEWFTV